MNAPVAHSPAFVYAPMFPLGPDATPWRKLEIAGVRTSVCDGKTVLRVAPEALSELAFQAFHAIPATLGTVTVAGVGTVVVVAGAVGAVVVGGTVAPLEAGSRVCIAPSAVAAGALGAVVVVVGAGRAGAVVEVVAERVDERCTTMVFAGVDGPPLVAMTPPMAPPIRTRSTMTAILAALDSSCR
ncbi:MAG: hypothetical protein ACRDNS_24715 [Trebonia sp.]